MSQSFEEANAQVTEWFGRWMAVSHLGKQGKDVSALATAWEKEHMQKLWEANNKLHGVEATLSLLGHTDCVSLFRKYRAQWLKLQDMVDKTVNVTDEDFWKAGNDLSTIRDEVYSSLSKAYLTKP